MQFLEHTLKKFSDCLNRCYIYAGIVLLTVLTAATFVQVVGRYVLNESPSWTEELARYSFVWANMLGCAIALKCGKHASVDLLVSKLHGSAKQIQRLVIDLLATFAGVLLLVEGYKMTTAIYAKGTLSPAMRIPMWLIYLSVVFCGLGILVHCILFLVEDVTAHRESEEKA